jgi:hypothetical protein
MKTSNKLLLLLGIIIVSSLIFYNFGLRAEYIKGEYKSRFYQMTNKKIEGFTSIENNASNLYVRIEQGDKFAVWFKNDVKNKIKFSKKNNTLIIDFKKENDEDDYFREENLIIICPRLENLISKKLYSDGNIKDKKSAKYYIPEGDITVYGFNQDKFNLLVNSLTEVNLEGNKFKNLTAKVGDDKSSIGTLNIKNNNEINNLGVDVKGKSILNLKNPLIKIAQLQLSDSANVNLSGRTLKLLTN